MIRIEFRLSMPSSPSWNGAWSGAGRNYSIVKSLTDKAASALMGDKATRAWFHSWDDGWGARVSARVVMAGERLPKSDGFAGYDWMVANILDHGDTRDQKDIAKAAKS
jgi:hypothetical protein